MHNALPRLPPAPLLFRVPEPRVTEPCALPPTAPDRPQVCNPWDLPPALAELRRLNIANEAESYADVDYMDDDTVKEDSIDVDEVSEPRAERE